MQSFVIALKGIRDYYQETKTGGEEYSSTVEDVDLDGYY